MNQTKNLQEKQSLQDSHPELALEADGWAPVGFSFGQINLCNGNAISDTNGFPKFQIELAVMIDTLLIWVREC